MVNYYKINLFEPGFLQAIWIPKICLLKISEDHLYNIR